MGWEIDFKSSLVFSTCRSESSIENLVYNILEYVQLLNGFIVVNYNLESQLIVAYDCAGKERLAEFSEK